MCWIEGNVNIHFFNLLNDNEQKEMILNFINTSFKSNIEDNHLKSNLTHHEPLLFQRFNWADQNHIYGAYTGFFIPGVQHIPEMWRCVADNFGEKLPNMPNLWFAGADYWTGLGNGYMEGAVSYPLSPPSALLLLLYDFQLLHDLTICLTIFGFHLQLLLAILFLL